MNSDLEELASLRMPRRALLARGIQAGAAMSGVGLLAGCGSSSSSGGSSSSTGGAPAGQQASGTMTFMNYPGFYTKEMAAALDAKYPDLNVKLAAGDVNGDVQAAGQVIQNQGSYDLAFLTVASAQQVVQAGGLEKWDFSKTPNIKNVDNSFRRLYPWGFPTDYGKIGFAYRKDLISERPTTWREFFQLIPKHSGKVVILAYDRDVIAGSLLALGKDPNSKNPADVKAATQYMIGLKKHVLQFAPTNISRPLDRGAAVLTMTIDADAAHYMGSNKNIVWVNPKEGVLSYLEGWVVPKGAKNPDGAYAFSNFFMQPKQYIKYVEPIPAYGTMSSAESLLPASIRKSSALVPAAPDIKLHVLTYLGADATKLWNDSWQQIQSA